MQIKQFTGDSVDEILSQIRKELGDEAVILQTKRVVRGGIAGFFGKQGVEVTAADGLSEDQAAAAALNLEAAHTTAAPTPGVEEPALDEGNGSAIFARHLSGQLAAAVEAEDPAAVMESAPPAAPAAAYARAVAPAPRPFAPGDAHRTQAIVEAARDALRKAHARKAAETAAAAPPVAHPVPAPPPPEPLAGDGAVLPPFVPTRRTDLPPEALGAFPAPAAPVAPAAFTEQVPPPPAPVAPPPAVVASPVVPEPVPSPAASELVAEPAELDRFEQDHDPLDAVTASTVTGLDGVRSELLAQGVAARYLDPLLEGFSSSALPFVDDPAGDLREPLRRWLADRLPVAREWRPRTKGATVVLVGQRGTGKTATAAKLAGRCSAAGMSVGLVVAGNGSPQALAEHGRALGLAIAVAPDLSSLAEVRAGLADRDVIIIDTPGCSAQDLQEIEELAALTKSVKPEEVHLVLPVSYPLADLGDVARRFRLVGVNRLTLTRLDETRFAGNVLNFPLRLGKPLAYIADGPEVPSALHAADSRDISELLLP